jgi:serine/threonine protein kinase
MDTAEMDRISGKLHQANSPEAVFGSLTGTHQEQVDAARSIFRHLAKVVHPDAFQGTSEYGKADGAFKKLVHLWEQAQARIASGVYGSESATSAEFAPFLIRTKTHSYSVERLLFRGDLCSLHGCSPLNGNEQSRVIAKVPIAPGDNDLVSNEARILEHLRSNENYGTCRHFVPQLLDALPYREKATGVTRQVNILEYTAGLYSLKEVRKAYPKGVDSKDMAWIWRRLLVALGFAHASHVIHGCVLPTHILIHPAQHAVVLIDWSYAVLDPAQTGERICAISSAYRNWYPAEVFAREEPTPTLDVFMAARCMIDLLGGDPEQQTFPETVPWQLQSFLKGCTLSSPQTRPQNTHVLLEEFDILIERLWGPRKFRAFIMP